MAVDGAGAGVLAGGVLAAGVGVGEEAGVGGEVGVTVGRGELAAGFAVAVLVSVTVLVTVGLGAGACTTAGADAPHAVTAAATMAAAPATTAMRFPGVLVFIIFTTCHIAAQTAHTREPADEPGGDCLNVTFAQFKAVEGSPVEAE